MNLLMLIIIFLALVVCVSIGYIAWELTREDIGESATGKSKEPELPD